MRPLCFLWGGAPCSVTRVSDAVVSTPHSPQNDLQAMARCHRIGQQKEVTIYRLLSRDTYEQAVFHSSSRKYGLDEAVLGGMGAQVEPLKQIVARLALECRVPSAC